MFQVQEELHGIHPISIIRQRWALSSAKWDMISTYNALNSSVFPQFFRYAIHRFVVFNIQLTNGRKW